MQIEQVGQKHNGKCSGHDDKLCSFWLRFPEHPDGGTRDQEPDSRPDSLKRTCDPADSEECIQIEGYNIQDQKGGHHHAQSRGSGSRELSFLIPDIGGAVNGDRSGGGLRNHDHLHHLFMGDPLLLCDAGILNESDHGISAPECEGTDPRKC